MGGGGEMKALVRIGHIGTMPKYGFEIRFLFETLGMF